MFQALWVLANPQLPNHCKPLGMQLPELESALHG